MMTIYTPEGQEFLQIPDDEFFEHITGMELLASHPEYNEETSAWSFIVYPDGIKMCTGQEVEKIPLAPDIDINRFKKHWYIHYCKAHGYAVVEDIP